jgi:hypothetical protein
MANTFVGDEPLMFGTTMDPALGFGGVPIYTSWAVKPGQIFVFDSNTVDRKIFAHSIEDLNWMIKLGTLLRDMRRSLEVNLAVLVAETERRLFG